MRLLPPLIVTEAEIDEAVGRFDAALTALEPAAAGDPGMSACRDWSAHFLDLVGVSTAGICAHARSTPAALKAAAAGETMHPSRSPARCWR